MANLTPVAIFNPVSQLETTDYVQGGTGGTSNRQAQELANRDEYLLQQLQLLAASLPATASGAVTQGVVDGTTGLETLLTIPAGVGVQLNASSGSPCVLAFQDGRDASTGVEKTKYARLTSNLTYNTFAGSRTYLVYALLVGTSVTLAATDQLRVTAYDGGNYVDPFVQNTTPSGAGVVNGALWYNPVENKWYIYSLSWTQAYVVPLGEVDTVSGVPNAVRTYTYGVPFYDTRTPAGTIIAHGSNARPRGGWAFCKGQTLTRTEYPRLFQAIGTIHGAPTGSTFNTPDLRGEFIRGWDEGRNVDTGRVFGSAQLDAFKSHTHRIAYQSNALNSVSPTTSQTVDWEAGGAVQSTNNVQPVGDTETRPRNVALGYWIKF